MLVIPSNFSLTACLNTGMYFSYIIYFQTQTTAMDTDDYDDKIAQNTDAQSSVSITNTTR